MEGNFAGEGLQTLDEDDDMLTSMAKELVEKNGIGESADMVWKRVNAEHQRLSPARTDAPIELGADPNPAVVVPCQPPSHPLIDAALNADPVPVFGQTALSVRNARRRERNMMPEHGLLFQQN